MLQIAELMLQHANLYIFLTNLTVDHHENDHENTKIEYKHKLKDR